ncbi:unnamed protein product [Rhizoctonia solani]|uniref:Uncharacterized protein n=1 Tax=Rhizoctonia solani TaxID=456999 RepID=A0A8H3CHP8_9AGAM|nr:unnamed protein product [Rhizoctonia solani]
MAHDYNKPHRTIHQFGPGNVHFHGKIFDDHDSEHSHHSLKSLIRPLLSGNGSILAKFIASIRSASHLVSSSFFDLVFVAIAHQLSEAVTQNASAAGLAKFVLIFE